jgi:hypothetical protein
MSELIRHPQEKCEDMVSEQGGDKNIWISDRGYKWRMENNEH